MHAKSSYYAAVIAVLLATAAMALAFGFVNTDSWNYLALAQSLRHGQGCSIGGAYYAIFPCGYPALLALTAPSADLYHLLLSSKITNFLLLAGSFVLLTRTLRNGLLPVILILNPVTLMIYQWTWSENLFLFAFSGAFYALVRLAREVNDGQADTAAQLRTLALLGFFLLLGCATRYVFGPYAAVMFVATWFCYGRKTALRALPAFVLAALFYLAYQKLNASLTGFSTGIPRVAAPETPALLVVLFLKALGRDTILVCSAIVLLLALSFRQLAPVAKDSTAPAQRSAAIFLMLCGAGYLALGFVLRLATFFDLYGPRTIGYGEVFVLAGLVGWRLRLQDPQRYPVLAVLAFGVYSALFSHATLLPRAIYQAFKGDYLTPAQVFQQYHPPATDADVIFSFNRRPMSPYMADNTGLYFGDKVSLLRPDIAPYPSRETLPHFIERVRASAGRRCVFDFTPFRSAAEFQQALDASFPVGISLSGGAVSEAPSYDAQLKAWLPTVFQPGSYVPCQQILAAAPVQ